MMRTFRKQCISPAFAFALLLGLACTGSPMAIAVTLPSSALVPAVSGSDLSLSFQTVGPGLYTIQTSLDLQRGWTNALPGIPGDGTLKTVTLSNAMLGDRGFYRLWIQTPTKLLLPQSLAFAILGHSCGGIKEQVYVTGFDPTNGYPTGEVHLSTTCSTGGRGSPTATFTAWAAVMWDLAGNVVASATLSNSVPINPTLLAADGYGDTIFNSGGAAYLVVPIPAVPTGVTAVQSGDQFEVSWTPNGVNPVAIASSLITATPVNSTAPVLSSAVVGSAATGIISSVEPQTTYEITVVNTTIAGSSPSSAAAEVTSSPATLPPSAPAGLSAIWANPNPTGATDTLVATWQAADPGNSPIDEYQITITGSDGAGTFTQTVSGTTLTTNFTIDYIPNWSVTVQAHSAFGWGPISSAFNLGGL